MQPVVVKYEDRVINAEGQLGVVRTGRHRTRIRIREKQNFADLTTDIYTVLTDILFVTHCCDWQRQLGYFLYDELKDLSDWDDMNARLNRSSSSNSSNISSLLHRDMMWQSQWLREGVLNMTVESRSMASMLEQLRTRIEKQPEVVSYPFLKNMRDLQPRCTTESMPILLSLVSKTI